jgi:hypothetical protein
MRRDCSKCYSKLESTPVRDVALVGARVAALRYRCPGCGKDYGEDYVVVDCPTHPAARVERAREQDRARQQRYLNKPRDPQSGTVSQRKYRAQRKQRLQDVLDRKAGAQ